MIVSVLTFIVFYSLSCNELIGFINVIYMYQPFIISSTLIFLPSECNLLMKIPVTISIYQLIILRQGSYSDNEEFMMLTFLFDFFFIIEPV